MNSKYSNVLTVLLVITIVAIVGLLLYLGYSYYNNSKSKSNAEDFVGTFVEDTSKTEDEEKEDSVSENIFEGIEGETETTTETSSGTSKVKEYKGYTIAGTIEIPAIKLKYPIIAYEEYSKSALETSVVEFYPGNNLNKVGNTTIVGHNYRNGQFFSNNKKLEIGDAIYITDLEGKRVKYEIYNKYEGSDTESEYITRDTNGKAEISLQTCTDDSSARLIIWAKAD